MEAAAGHSLSAEAVSLSQHDGEDRDGDVGTNDVKTAAMPHERFLLVFWSDHVAGRIAERDNGNIKGVAELHEARSFIGGIRIDGATEMLRVICDDADRSPFESGQAGDNPDAEIAAQLEHRIRIRHQVDRVPDLVDAQPVFGHDITQQSLVRAVPVFKWTWVRDVFLRNGDGFRFAFDGNRQPRSSS